MLILLCVCSDSPSTSNLMNIAECRITLSLLADALNLESESRPSVEDYTMLINCFPQLCGDINEDDEKEEMPVATSSWCYRLHLFFFKSLCSNVGFESVSSDLKNYSYLIYISYCFGHNDIIIF